MTDEEVEAALTEVPGIGPWSARGFLLVALDRPDVYLTGDIALRRAIQRVYGFDHVPSDLELAEISDRWRPYRSLAVSYLFASEYEAPADRCRHHRRRPARPGNGARRGSRRPFRRAGQQPRPGVAAPQSSRLSAKASPPVRRADAAAAAIVVIAVPWGRVPDAVDGLQWDGRVVIDTTNDWAADDLEGRTSSEIVANLVAGARVVKAANTLVADVLSSDPRQPGGRRVIFISGDDQDAKATVHALFDDAGFAVIDLGGLAEGGELQQIHHPLAGVNLLRSE